MDKTIWTYSKNYFEYYNYYQQEGRIGVIDVVTDYALV